MKTKCEKCSSNITIKNIHKCKGLMCSKIYCNLCYIKEFSICSICYQTMLCPMCVMIWDICPSCLEKDNAILYCNEQISIDL